MADGAGYPPSPPLSGENISNSKPGQSAFSVHSSYSPPARATAVGLRPSSAATTAYSLAMGKWFVRTLQDTLVCAQLPLIP